MGAFMKISKAGGGVFALCFILLSSGCGMRSYPGQPGMTTDSYSKVNMEDLEAEGLYVYEVTYDNHAGGTGVGAILTKLYPGAQTYTSNVRTNADGTLYYNKVNYNGAVTEMISIPQENQIILPPNSTVQLLMDYSTSMDEIDDKNTAEQAIFAPNPPPAKPLLGSQALQRVKARFDLLRAARLTNRGTLAYEIDSIGLADKTFVPTQPVNVETSFLQNGIQTDVTSAIRADAVTFIEANFPKGFKGVVNLNVKGSTTPLQFTMGIQTLKTAAAAGIKITQNASQEQIDTVMNRYHLSN